jgi:hypothetical protein
MLRKGASSRYKSLVEVEISGATSTRHKGPQDTTPSPPELQPQPPEVPTLVVLPPGWEEAFDESGTAYFFNTATGESQWEPPAGSRPAAPHPQAVSGAPGGGHLNETDLQAIHANRIAAAMAASEDVALSGSTIQEAACGSEYLKSYRDLARGNLRSTRQGGAPTQHRTAGSACQPSSNPADPLTDRYGNMI